MIYLLAAAAYTTGVGDGDPVAGLEIIGQGKDPLSQVIASGMETAVTLSMDVYPKETTAVLEFLSGVGETIDATVTYADDRTGRVVSTQWNSLSQATRDRLKGGGKVIDVVLNAGQVHAVKIILGAPKVVGVLTPDVAIRKPVGVATPDGATLKPVGAATPDITTPGAVNWTTPKKNLRGKSFENNLESTKYSQENGYVMLDKIQHNHKTFDSFNRTTGHAVSIKTMDTLGLSGSKPMTPGQAAGYLRRYVKEAKDYEKSAHQANGIEAGDIQSRRIELAIP
ncbi:hypothetical protein, partial [Verminephrobacter aporrectodeae]|uniref:endonuclease toxin domain-containing protein n=1 Tax=Verminephrobacter aporrectodeae TaxID=1110389 RepID=UPI00059510C6